MSSASPTTDLLLVDDNAENLFVLEQIFNDNQWQIRSASTGAECLKEIEFRKPELILLDVQLPDTLGTELCREIKSTPRWKDIIIMLISSSLISSDERAFGLELGADDYITRPASRRELLARVEAALRFRELHIGRRLEAPYSHLDNDSTRETEAVFQQQRMRLAYPKHYSELVDRYSKLLAAVFKSRLQGEAFETAESLRSLAAELGYLKGSARDIIEIHAAALRMLPEPESTRQGYYLREESRILLVELMGYMVNYYRVKSS